MAAVISGAVPTLCDIFGLDASCLCQMTCNWHRNESPVSMRSLVGHLVVISWREGNTTDDMALKTELFPDDVSPSAAIWGRSFPKIIFKEKLLKLPALGRDAQQASTHR